MYRGKRAKGWTIKSGILLASLVLLTVLTVGTTVAFLMDDTNTVTNAFTPAHVSCAISETFDGTSKQYVKVQNTGDIDAYIRAEIVVNWVKSGTNKIVPVVPAGYDYTLTLNNTGWTAEQTDGYYYYTSKVAAGDFTTALIDLAEPKYPSGVTIANAPYRLQVEILAEAIQADGLGVDSAQEAWTKAGGGTS